MEQTNESIFSMLEEEEIFAYNEERKTQEAYEKFLVSTKAKNSKDQFIQADRKDLLLKDTTKEIYVLLEDKKKYINFERLSEKFPVQKWDEWNNSIYSFGQKIKGVKRVYRDNWTDTIKHSEIIKEAQ